MSRCILVSFARHDVADGDKDPRNPVPDKPNLHAMVSKTLVPMKGVRLATCLLVAASVLVYLGGGSIPRAHAKDVGVDVVDSFLHKISTAKAGGLSTAVANALAVLSKRESTQDKVEVFVNDAKFINGLVSWMLPVALRNAMPDFLLSWFRNWFFGLALYLVVGSLWAYYVYFCFGKRFFKEGNVPTINAIAEQVKVSILSMPGYALLPTVTEYVVERGYTLAYPRVDDVGLVKYIGLFFVYMAVVEFGVYWSHRILHIGWGYKYLHATHHIYNKEHSLSPFAGLAFNALDGVMQGVPYSLALFLVPMHYLTHLLLLFLTGVWTTNIHDCVDGGVEPIMGSGYHTIHHTTYKDNYGHYFIFMDWIFGTLITPEEYEAKLKKEKR